MSSKHSDHGNHDPQARGLSRLLIEHDGLVKLAQIIIIPLTLGVATIFLSYSNSDRERRLAEDKRFVEIIDKLEVTMNAGDSQSITIDAHPALGLPLKEIHSLDTQAKAYLGMLAPGEKARLVSFLYHIGLIKHTVADQYTIPGTIGKCRLQPSRGRTLYCNITGSGLALNKMDASDLSLRQVKIIFSSLNDAKFNRSDLYGAELMGSSLVRADLSGANLKKSYLISADLRQANLAGADLTGAYLQCSNLSQADLESAKWDPSHPPMYNKRTIFPSDKQPWLGANRSPWKFDDGPESKFQSCPYSPPKNED